MYFVGVMGLWLARETRTVMKKVMPITNAGSDDSLLRSAGLNQPVRHETRRNVDATTAGMDMPVCVSL